MSRVLDRIDRRILDELQRDGRLSIVELAKRVFLTKTPTAERVRRLEKTGIIDGYYAQIAPAKIDLNHVTIVHVSLNKNSDNALDDFSAAVLGVCEVQSCLMIAGSFDYMLKIRTRDILHFREVLGEKIGKLPGVMQTHSFSVIETVKDSNAIDLTDLEMSGGK